VCVHERWVGGLERDRVVARLEGVVSTAGTRPCDPRGLKSRLARGLPAEQQPDGKGQQKHDLRQDLVLLAPSGQSGRKTFLLRALRRYLVLLAVIPVDRTRIR
jgi:hypothetical protein